jgi:hypothetical protein
LKGRGGKLIVFNKGGGHRAFVEAYQMDPLVVLAEKSIRGDSLLAGLCKSYAWGLSAFSSFTRSVLLQCPPARTRSRRPAPTSIPQPVDRLHALHQVPAPGRVQAPSTWQNTARGRSRQRRSLSAVMITPFDFLRPSICQDNKHVPADPFSLAARESFARGEWYESA